LQQAGGALTGNNDTGEDRRAEPRWGAIYIGVALFTLAMIAALIAFSAHFAA